MGRLTTRRAVVPLRRDVTSDGDTRVDTLAVEEPLELRIGGEPFAVTMRTPGHDVELAHGLLLSEGVIARPADVRSAHRCGGGSAGADNVLDLMLAPGVAPPAQRRLVTTSACGVCGVDSIDAVRARIPAALGDGPTVTLPADLVMDLPRRLRAHQALFGRTGGMHAAGLFDAAGSVIAVREDVGRHNALDKLMGRTLLDGALPADQSVLVVSGRASFELVQKAAVGGVPVLVAVSAPSSLAVALADELGMTLVGFTRERSANVYTHPHRIT